MERKLLLMRVDESLIPAPGGAVQLDLPETVDAVLDQGWRVVSHHLTASDLSGSLLLSLFIER